MTFLAQEAFWKYQGLGNDFVILDRRQTGRDIDAEWVQRLCNRRMGIGADGVLVMLPSSKSAWGKMVVHNADGSIPEMCGNGLRCAVKFLLDGLPQKPESVQVETGAGVLTCVPIYGEAGVQEVQIDMGPARWVADHLPSAQSGQPYVNRPVPGLPGVLGSAVSMGNPHWVLWNVPSSNASEWGPKLEHGEGFPERTNVEFVRPTPNGLEVVVWERGVGLTLACGTGACASVAVATQLGWFAPEHWVSVQLPGGVLSVWVRKDFSSVLLRGPVEYVFSGQFGVVPSAHGH